MVALEVTVTDPDVLQVKDAVVEPVVLILLPREEDKVLLPEVVADIL